MKTRNLPPEGLFEFNSFRFNHFMSKTKVALLGAGFIADIHMESYERFVPEAEVVAVYSRSLARAQEFARKFHIPKASDNLEQVIADSACEVVDICIPNCLHHKATLAA